MLSSHFQIYVIYINNARNNFDEFKKAAKENNQGSDYKDKFKRKSICRTRITFSSETVQLRGNENFRVDTFISISDINYVFKKKTFGSIPRN